MQRLVWLSLMLLPASPVVADEAWGHLRIRFTFQGKAPPPELIEVTKDQAELGESLPDNSLLINPDNQGIANVVVYLLTDRKQELAVHPDYEDTARDKVQLTSRRGQFHPHVLLLRTSQTLVLNNKGRVDHFGQIAFFKNIAR